MRKILPILFLVLIAGCGGLFHKRSFMESMDHKTDGMFVAERDFPVMSGDTGRVFRNGEELLGRMPASEEKKRSFREEMALANELHLKERRLASHQKESYREEISKGATVSEKIYYLDLPRRKDQIHYAKGRSSLNERRLASRGRRSLPTKRNKGTLSILKDESDTQKELFLGMEKQAVVKILGRPARVDTAGDPSNQNERWTFNDGGKGRVVYFESGIVDGWRFD